MTDVQHITDEHVAAIERVCARETGAWVIDTDDSVALHLLRAGVEELGRRLGLGGERSREFLEGVLGERSFALGSLAYINEAERGWGRVCTVVHECVHVRQWREYGLRGAGLYLWHEEKKIEAEAESYGAEAQVVAHFTGALPPLEHAVEHLRAPMYNVSPAGLDLARGIMAQKGTAVAQGLTTDPLARAVIRELVGLGYAPTTRGPGA